MLVHVESNQVIAEAEFDLKDYIDCHLDAHFIEMEDSAPRVTKNYDNEDE